MIRQGVARAAAAALLAAVAGLLGGCLPSKPGSSAGSGRACLAENAKFTDAWACIKTRAASRDSAGSATRDGFLEEGDLLATQVRSGKVTEAEARRRLGAGLAHEDGL